MSAAFSPMWSRFRSEVAALVIEALSPFAKGDPGGNTMAIGSFIGASTLLIPLGTDMVQTSGYSANGVGAARYVADALADADLVAAHPTCAFTSTNGRHFRLLPERGLVVLSQAGCIGTDGTPDEVWLSATNNQPTYQAALEYFRAIGARGVLEDSKHYSIWGTVKVPDLTLPDTTLDSFRLTNLTGVPLLIYRKTVLYAPEGTTYWRRTFEGKDPAVFANTQTMADTYGYGYWRGGLFGQVGQADMPDDFDDLPGLQFVGKHTLAGGIPQSDNPGSYTVGGKDRLRADGSAWDLMDKPIWPTPNSKIGNVEFDDLEIDGFRGESLWRGGITTGSIIGKTLKASNCDGTVLDANLTTAGQRLDIDRAEFYKVYNTMERSGGYNSRIGEFIARDCQNAGLAAGTTADTETVTAPFKVGQVHVERVTSGFMIGRNVHIGQAVGIDCHFVFGAAERSSWNARVGQMTVLADRANVVNACRFVTMTGNTVLTTNCRVADLYVGRTPYAIANGFRVNNPVDYNNQLGPDCTVGKLAGYSAEVPRTRTLANITGWHVGIEDMTRLNVANIATGSPNHNVETDANVAYVAAMQRLIATTTGLHVTATLPNLSGILPVGAMWGLFNESAGGSSPGGFVSIATANTNLTRPYVIPWRRWVWFRVATDGSRWELMSQHKVLTGATTINVAAIAADGLSAAHTITVPGARAGMKASVTLPSTSSINLNNLVERAWISADDTVSFVLRDVTGAGNDPANASYTGVVSWES